MGNLWQDLRYGLQVLLKKPGFTLIAVLTLALGIGANAAIFSFINAFLLRPLPFSNPDQLVHVWETNQRQDVNTLRVSVPNFLDWRAQNTVFTDLGAFNYTEENLTSGAEPERVNAGRVSANIFDLLGVQPAMGRGFALGEDQAGQGKVVVLSHQFWQQRFGGSQSALGQTLNLDDEAYTIIGVMPPDFVFPLPTTQLWAPRILDPTQSARARRLLQVVGRLKPGIGMEQAQAEMTTIAGRIATEYPRENENRSVNIVPLRNALNFAFEIMQPMSLVLILAVGFVLLIACANVASLLLARAIARSKEIAVRMALGASRWRIIRQLLTESLLISLLGGALGIALAVWAVNGLNQVIPPDLYQVGGLSVDAQALAFTLGLCLLTAIIFGLAPALQISRADINETLKEGGRDASIGGRGQRLHSFLVVAEIALSLMLLIGAGLMIRTLTAMQQVNTGFDHQGVLTMKLILPESKYADPVQLANFHQRVIERAESLPEVASAATVNYLPLNHEMSETEFQIAGQSPDPTRQIPTATTLRVSPNYFKVMGIPVRTGRIFTAQDDAQATQGVVINEMLARRFFSDVNPLGRQLALKRSNGEFRSVTILGVVGNIKYWDLADRNEMQIYLAQLQNPWNYFRLIVKTNADPINAAGAVRQAVWAIDRDLPVTEIRTMEQVVSDYLLPQRSMVVTLIALALGALILATVGIYGVMSYKVTQYTKEIGIRLALGAQPGDILKLVVGQGLLLTLIGVGIGLAGAFALTQLMEALLYGVSATDTLTFALISALLTVVALVACYVPARRAMKVDPMIVLRFE